MAYSLENTTDLTNLGNSIRTKTSTTATMTVAEMATAVAGITGGGGGSNITTLVQSAIYNQSGVYLDPNTHQTYNLNIPYDAENGIVSESFILLLFYDTSNSGYPSNFMYIVGTPNQDQDYYDINKTVNGAVYLTTGITTVEDNGDFYWAIELINNGNSKIYFRANTNSSTPGGWLKCFVAR